MRGLVWLICIILMSPAQSNWKIPRIMRLHKTSPRSMGYSGAIGSFNSAIGPSNSAIGSSNSAIGSFNSAIGSSNSAIGSSNSAIGSSNSAIGPFNSAISSSNSAIGSFNSAIGSFNSAIGSFNSAIGSFNSAIGSSNSAIGSSNSAIGSFNSAIGSSNSDILPHKDLREGTLTNGMKFKLLKNPYPSNTVDIYLEILGGSACERDDQRGMSHLLEHVAYMGGLGRQNLGGLDCTTNAFTDFHHSVFFASCPLVAPNSNNLLRRVCEAISRVFRANIEEGRLEREKAAVLSEASAVNNLQRRLYLNSLAELHKENILCKRFPIGQLDIIRSCSVEDLEELKNRTYQPSNAILYVVGDIDLSRTQKVVEDIFSCVPDATSDANSLETTSGTIDSLWNPITMRQISRHYPPVLHSWSCGRRKAAEFFRRTFPRMDPLAVSQLVGSKSHVVGSQFPEPLVTPHPLQKTVVLQIYFKYPIRPITSISELRNSLMYNLVVSALNARLGMLRGDGVISAEMSLRDSPREGCTVGCLEVNCDPLNWTMAVFRVVKEVKSMGYHGLSDMEFRRMKTALMSEYRHDLIKSNKTTHEEVINALMHSTACGHTYMDPIAKYTAAKNILSLDSNGDDSTITLSEVNRVAQDMCTHISHGNLTAVSDGERVAAIVFACPDTLTTVATPQQVTDVLVSAIEADPTPALPVDVPTTLLNAQKLADETRLQSLRWVSFLPHKGRNISLYEPGRALKSRRAFLWEDETHPLIQGRLSNGLQVNFVSTSHIAEPGIASIRIWAPGMEREYAKPAAVYLAARMMMEGGAMSNFSREAVELFCTDRGIHVDIRAERGAIVMDIETNHGLETVLQMAHCMLSSFKWESDAFERAVAGAHHHINSCNSDLFSLCRDVAVRRLTGNDSWVSPPSHRSIDNISFEEAKCAAMKQILSPNVEVSVAADLSVDEISSLTQLYLGTVPRYKGRFSSATVLDEQHIYNRESNFSGSTDDLLRVQLGDSEERGVGVIAGHMYRKDDVYGRKDGPYTSHILYPRAVALVLQEIANRRLFEIVREERGLCYDASFEMSSIDSDITRSSIYTVTVSTSPSQIENAVWACRDVLLALQDYHCDQRQMDIVKRHVVNRLLTQTSHSKFWVDSMSGSQTPECGRKSLNDLAAVVESITNQDVREFAVGIKLGTFVVTCVGISQNTE